MKAIRKSAILAFIVILLFSCTVYRQVPIEVLRTEEVKLRPAKPRMTFVYRNFKFEVDTLQQYFLENDLLVKDPKTKEKLIDSLVVNACLVSAGRSMKQNGICDDPAFYPYSIFPRQTGDMIIPLPANLVKKLAMPVKADYLVVLETFSCFFSKYYNRGEGNFQQVKAVAVWNLYDATTGKVEDHKSMADTLSWDLYSSSGKFVKTVLPPRITALQQAAEVFGENYAKRFFREWITVDRTMIVPPLEDFRIAADEANKQEWKKAAAIWQKYSDQRLGRLAASACYDLALAREISDDLAGAVNWINKAASIADSYKNSDEQILISQYQAVLKKRKSEIDKAKESFVPMKSEQ
jgi:hypothetical protein